jgi:hypothetical protein
MVNVAADSRPIFGIFGLDEYSIWGMEGFK